MSPDAARPFILLISKREALSSAIREHIPADRADLQRVGGPEEARRYAQRHSPSLVVVDGDIEQGMRVVGRVREDVAPDGVKVLVRNRSL